ncbi:MAG: glycosyltransferase [Proteobacteria bacterium]|nr:glycosyltransferase [Pseudomonadota bacterium]
MEKEPLVSIITATYNLISGGRRDIVLKNLESVKSQTYRNIEHIVIDGASTDGTLELLKPYADAGQIKIYSEPDAGIYDAMNKGIARAAGKYVVILNSDDYYVDNDAVADAVALLEKTGATYSHAIANHEWIGRPDEEYAIQGLFCHQTALVRRDAMMAVGNFDLRYKISADSHLFLKLLVAGGASVFLNKNTVFYSGGGVSSVLPNDRQVMLREYSEIIYDAYGRDAGLTRYECMLIADRSAHEDPAIASRVADRLPLASWRKNFMNKVIAFRCRNNAPDKDFRILVFGATIVSVYHRPELFDLRVWLLSIFKRKRVENLTKIYLFGLEILKVRTGKIMWSETHPARASTVGENSNKERLL